MTDFDVILPRHVVIRMGTVSIDRDRLAFVWWSRRIDVVQCRPFSVLHLDRVDRWHQSVGSRSKSHGIEKLVTEQTCRVSNSLQARAKTMNP